MIKWDKAFIINLDCDKDKWRPLSKFTELERFPALDSREQPFMYRDYGFELAPSTDLYRYMNEYFSQSKGAVGCYFSHYTVQRGVVAGRRSLGPGGGFGSTTYLCREHRHHHRRRRRRRR